MTNEFIRAIHDGSCLTATGISEFRAGDLLCITNPEDIYPISQDKFEELYDLKIMKKIEMTENDKEEFVNNVIDSCEIDGVEGVRKDKMQEALEIFLRQLEEDK